MKFKINGGRRLSGRVKAQGAKNSILPILSACVLCRGEVVLKNCPELSDVDSALSILNHLGIKSERQEDNIIVYSQPLKTCRVPEKLMREMRSSVVFLGAILASSGCAEISMPGGCELGPRPIDIHISSLKKLGAEIIEEGGNLKCSAKNGLKGTQISLIFPSVGATENIILAACLAKGTTVINNAAREPEIVDLANFLNKCGAKIMGAGSDKIIIEGVTSLGACEHSIMPDRIVLVTYLTAAAVTGGEITVTDAVKEDALSVLSLLKQSGCEITERGTDITLSAPKVLDPMYIVKTMPHPGFPTDAQAPIMTLASLCNGTTMFVETIFENRYRHACELRRMGADIKIDGRVAVVNGVKSLHSACVSCTDLRGGAALLLACLSAEGESVLSEIEHIDRGYEKMENTLSSLGAEIIRM